MAVAIPVAGWLGDRFGAREIFLLSVGLFTVASAACGLAQTVEQLVIFRIVQGIGGGLMTPVGMSMLYRSFPPNERVRLSRMINVPIALAPAIGPVLGGLLVQKASWRWIFGINIPIGVLAVVFTLIAVPTMARTDLQPPGRARIPAGRGRFRVADVRGVRGRDPAAGRSPLDLDLRAARVSCC